MESRAKILGHPAHPILIVFPLGLLGTSIIFDILYLSTGGGRWADISFWNIGIGIISGVVAAVFGLIDWLAIPSNTRAKKIGLMHGVGNLFVLILFALSWYLRYDLPTVPSTTAILLSGSGVILSFITGWLGGELVDRLGVGVDDGAHLNASNSLTSSRVANSGIKGPGARYS